MRHRIKKIQAVLEESNIDCFFSMNPSTVRYFSNVAANRYPERAVYFLVARDQAYVITNLLEYEQTKDEAKDCEVLLLKSGAKLEDLIAEVVKIDSEIGLEYNQISYSFAERIRNKGFKIKDLSLEVSKIRAVKEEEEIEKIKDAIKKTERVLKKVKDYIINEKTTEKEAAKYCMKLLIEESCEWFSFEPIIASGKNAAFPHAVPSYQLIADNTFTIVDIGGRNEAGGYCADITRTFAKGIINEELKENFEAVKNALEEAIDAIHAGVIAKEVDSIARKALAKKNLENKFVHGLGHGLGLDVHEFPAINSLSDNELLENYVITIEPGIYIPNNYGIRLEQDVLVKKDKAEVLTEFPLDYS